MVRVLAFTDEPICAAGLKCVLKKKTGFRLAATADNPATLIETAEAVRPDILLLDMTPDMTFGILMEFQERLPECRIVVWVRAISKELAYQAIEHGVRGILRRTVTAESLLKCLRMVADGGLWFEESLRNGLLDTTAVALSRRESQMVSLLAQGLKNKEIASLLHLSNGTVKVYLSRLFRKLGVNDRFELALFGLRNMPEAGFAMESQKLKLPVTRRGSKDAAPPEWLRTLLLDRPGGTVRGIVS